MLSTPRHPLNVQYSPNGQTVLGLDTDDRAFFVHLAKKEGEEKKEEWTIGREESPAYNVRDLTRQRLQTQRSLQISECLWSHDGQAIFFAIESDGVVKTVGYPSLEKWDAPGCHIGGCYTIDLHPRGR